MMKPRYKNVSAQVLRQIFNDSGYWELAKQGKLSVKPYFERVPRKNSKQPPGTISQIVAYLDANGRQVAVVHQYLRRDGTLGGSGQPDPKKVVYDGTVYLLDESLT